MSSSHQRGYSLAEVLVALAIFALIFVAALAVYDQSNKQFKRGIEAAETQQNVRVAFDKMVADIRMAGYDFDRDGIPTGSAGVPWQPSRNYGIGNLVVPPTPNGFVYWMVSVVGAPTATSCTSGASPGPTWSTTVNNEFNDNNCRWRTLQGINQAQQPDEQIEFAGPTALTIRANYDYELKEASDTENGREPDLESAQFPVVTTGNDEIVTYALRSVNGSNPDDIIFYADVACPSGAPASCKGGRLAYPGSSPARPENTVTIPNVTLGDTTSAGCSVAAPCFNDPPYTLYRFTLAPNGSPVETPLASNIRSLRFEYYTNVRGVPPTTVPTGWSTATQLTSPGGGQFNPGNTTTGVTERAARAIIRSVRMTLIGMGESPEGSYRNLLEPANSPVTKYRTYRLESLIVPRNLGKQGMREIPPSPPGAPMIVDITYGYCGAVMLSWTAPGGTAGTGQVESYSIMYNELNNGIFPMAQDVGPNTSGVVSGLDPTKTYYFTVAAVNSYGYQMAVVPGTQNIQVISAQPQNSTSPGLPTGGIGTGSGITGAPPAEENQITITWVPPSTNGTPGSGTRKAINGSLTTIPLNPLTGSAEITTYRVFRSTTAIFTPATGVGGNEVQTTSPNQLDITGGQVTFVDKTALNCVPYYYKVLGVEGGCVGCGSCNINGAIATTGYYPAVGAEGIAGLGDARQKPAAPVALTVDPNPSLTSACAGPRCDVYIRWPKVKTDISTPPKPLVIQEYDVIRKRYLGNVLDDTVIIPYTDPSPLVGEYVPFADENLPAKHPSTGVDYTYEYQVVAKQCPDSATPPVYSFISDPSPALKFPCPFSGTIASVGVSLTLDGDGLTPATAWLTNNPASEVIVTGSSIQSVQALLDNGSSIINLGTSAAGPEYRFPLAQTQAGELYRLYIIAKDVNGCTETFTRYLEEATATGCCLAASAIDPGVVSYIPGTSYVQITFKNQCVQPAVIQSGGVELKWDPAIVANGISTAVTLTSVDFPTAGTGSAVLPVNDTAAAGSTGIRTNVLTPPTGQSPAAIDTIPASSGNYVITIRFDRILANANSPITSACVIYRRPTVDSTDQACKIVPQPTTFNSCN